MIGTVHHVALSTPNLARLLEFYRDMLGFEEVMFNYNWQKGTANVNQVLGLPDSAGSIIMIKRDNLCLELWEFEAPIPAPADPQRPVNNYGWSHIALNVTNIDSVYQRLLDAGVQFHCPPQDFGTLRSTYGRDPDGNVFEIQEELGTD